MTTLKKLFILALAASVWLLTEACRDPYRPDIISSDRSYLVVEGILNPGQEPSTIRLSRTFRLEDTAVVRWENNATVTVESRQGLIQQLPMTVQGSYSANLQINLDEEYRVKIMTQNGTEYISEFVQPRVAHPIDSIGWIRNEEGLRVYVNTGDGSDNTTYYMWDYDETFEIHSFYYSAYIYEDLRVRERRLPEEEIYRCWKNDRSRNILVSSTARLGSDLLHQAPVAFFYNGDEKLAVRYSMLLRQYAISKEAYEFFSLMKQNTENIGTIFDPQPSEIRGNITCLTRPEEPVIGYVIASTVTEKRKFISNSEIGGWRFSQYCYPDTILYVEIVDKLEGGAFVPYAEAFSPDDPTLKIGYLGSYTQCVDCRARGGTLTRPGFW